MIKTTFTDDGLEEYADWSDLDKKKFKKINALIKSIKREGLLKGLGHPERLKHEDSYTREIDKYNRLRYRVDEHGNLEIMSCKGHP
ncbi:MAG: type II toxin-antitoxin system YoeB family toxin [Firmicutes bacterium]|nr:type II toxin-antitoxin system YoeB family toxin [Bacillota bacterium]